MRGPADRVHADAPATADATAASPAVRGVARINRPAVRCSPVAGRDEDGITFALQSAGHGVFASAAAEHEDFHARANSKVSLGATPETSTGYFPVKQAVQ